MKRDVHSMQVRFDVPDKFYLNAIPGRVDLKIGQKVGDYTIEKVLGNGTYGIVYKVTKNNKTYALKLLKLWEIPYVEDKQAIGERFLREYLASQIQSEYLVHAHQFGLIDNNPFFVMDFLKGGDLRSKVGKLSINEIQMIGYHTLKGLRDLHLSGIIHRDVKPENVMIDETGKALLTDFGISAFVKHHAIKRGTKPNFLGHVKQTFGTYAYIAPEQLIDSKKFNTTTPRTDIWSWGVMMFELFGNGVYPWGELETESDLADFIKNAKAGNIVNYNVFNKMPSKWADVIKQCLQPIFEKRVEKVDYILYQLSSNDIAPIENTIADTDSIILKILQGVEQGREYVLYPNKKIYTLGRSEENDFIIEDFQTLYISRKHCTFECVPSLKGWFIRDGQWDASTKTWKRSTNGTYLNSSEVDYRGSKLKNGDIITVGDTTIKVMTNH